MLSDPGDPVGTRSRHRRRGLEDEILPDIGPMDRHVLGLTFDIGLIDAMGGADASRRYPTAIRDVDLDFTTSQRSPPWCFL